MAPHPVPILYQDPHLLVVDKPAGMLTVPAPRRRGTADVVAAVGAALGERLFAVHRLDEESSGALALARSPAARAALEPLFRRHAAERVYLALVARKPTPAAGTIESRLVETASGMMRSVTSGGGEHAVTHYRTLGRRGRCTLVECRLETGRRNQIRVHLAELGSPLCGDRKYGWRPRADDPVFARVMLHAWRLRFTHPLTGAEVDVVAPPPHPLLVPEPGEVAG